MIELKMITKKYQNNVIISDFNYKFEQAKMYVLKGPSGSGKTTLLNIISGIDCDFDGECIKNNELKQIGYIFQQSLLVSELSVEENLLLISSDKSKILYYCKLFNIDKIIYKYPTELSGGERQRVSIVRAILSSSDLIIADEPTSSLDLSNANKIVDELNKLKLLNRTVIVATHDQCFDPYADEILYIEDGKINKTIINKTTDFISETYPIKKVIKNNFNDIDRKYVLKRFKKNCFKSGTLFLSIMLSLLIIFLGIKDNFKDEYVKKFEEIYPVNTFSINKEDISTFKNIIPIEIYDDYSFRSENGVYFYGLPKYDDSIFKDEKNIISGKFPTELNEALISQNLYMKLFGENNFSSHINEKVELEGINLIISGVITNMDEKLNMINSSNPYYHIESDDLVVLMQNDNLKLYGELKNSNKVFVSCENLYKNKFIDAIYDLEFSSVWEQKIDSYNYSINFFFNIYLLVLAFILLIVFIYIYNEASFRLFVRKKEIGYLQIFGVSKSRIKKILIMEFSYQFMKSLVYSILIVFSMLCSLKFVYEIELFPNIITLMLIIISFIIYIIIMFYFPIRKILKKSIINLIN